MEPESFFLLVESGKRWYGAIALGSLSLFAGRFPALCESDLMPPDTRRENRSSFALHASHLQLKYNTVGEKEG